MLGLLLLELLLELLLLLSTPLLLLRLGLLSMPGLLDVDETGNDSVVAGGGSTLPLPKLGLLPLLQELVLLLSELLMLLLGNCSGVGELRSHPAEVGGSGCFCSSSCTGDPAALASVAMHAFAIDGSLCVVPSPLLAADVSLATAATGFSGCAASSPAIMEEGAKEALGSWDSMCC